MSYSQLIVYLLLWFCTLTSVPFRWDVEVCYTILDLAGNPKDVNFPLNENWTLKKKNK